MMANARSTDGRSDHPFPWPHIVPALRTHTHSAIILHGRGGSGQHFGEVFVQSPTSSGKTLREELPHYRFIFPTARELPVTVFASKGGNALCIKQWFDILSLKDPALQDELQLDGLHASSLWIHDVIRQEAKRVGLHRVVVGGLSQGMALGLHVLMNFSMEGWEGEGIPHLPAFFGMSGWLPFAYRFQNAIVQGKELESGNSVAANDGIERKQEEEEMGAKKTEMQDEDKDSTGKTKANIVVADTVMSSPSGSYTQPRSAAQFAVNEALAIANITTNPLPASEPPPFVHTPVFLGHGTADEKVAFYLGEQARDILRNLGCTVTWRAYQKCMHWYKVPDEIDDILDFLGALGLREASAEPSPPGKKWKVELTSLRRSAQ